MDIAFWCHPLLNNVKRHVNLFCFMLLICKLLSSLIFVVFCWLSGRIYSFIATDMCDFNIKLATWNNIIDPSVVPFARSKTFSRAFKAVLMNLSALVTWGIPHPLPFWSNPEQLKHFQTEQMWIEMHEEWCYHMFTMVCMCPGNTHTCPSYIVEQFLSPPVLM